MERENGKNISVEFEDCFVTFYKIECNMKLYYQEGDFRMVYDSVGNWFYKIWDKGVNGWEYLCEGYKDNVIERLTIRTSLREYLVIDWNEEKKGYVDQHGKKYRTIYMK